VQFMPWKVDKDCRGLPPTCRRMNSHRMRRKKSGGGRRVEKKVEKGK